MKNWDCEEYGFDGTAEDIDEYFTRENFVSMFGECELTDGEFETIRTEAHGYFSRSLDAAIASIKSLYDEAHGDWTGAWWDHDVIEPCGYWDHGNIYPCPRCERTETPCRTEDPENCQECADAKSDAEECEELAEIAMECIASGDFGMAARHAENISALERRYGDDVTWGRWSQAVEGLYQSR